MFDPCSPLRRTNSVKVDLYNGFSSFFLGTVRDLREIVYYTTKHTVIAAPSIDVIRYCKREGV
jgi:hypothetical protein